MDGGGPGRRNDPRLLSSLETAVTEVHRAGPAELAWNWRWELGLLGGLAAAAGFVAREVGLLGLTVTAGAGLAAGTAALLCWPSARRWLASRIWCIVTPHRVRAGCRGSWVQTRSGRLPFVMGATPADYGEQVKLWLFAGHTAADLDAARHVLAAACWAADVRVVPSARHAHLVTLQVIRNRYPERVRLTGEAWPSPRHVADDGLGDADEQGNCGWPWTAAG